MPAAPIGANFTGMHRLPEHDLSAHARQRQAALLRIALLLGVLIFGCVTWYIHRDPQWRPAAPEPNRTLVMATYLAWAVGLLGVLIVRGIHARARDETRLATALLGWSLGELVAIAGGVYYFMTDDPSRYLYGLLFMLATYILFPIRRH